MSWIGTLVKDTESVASKIEHELEVLWTKAPTAEAVISTTLTYVGPLLETVVTVEAGAAAGTAVTAVINKAEQDLVAAKALITTVGPTPSIASLISGVSNNLSSLLTAANISDPKSVATVKLVISELAAVASAFPPA